MNELDAGARPSSAWQRVSSNPSRFGGNVASSSGILDAFADIFAQIATSDRAGTSNASGPADDSDPADPADGDDDRTATSAESDDDSDESRSAEPRLELPDSPRPDSPAAVASERSPADRDGPTTRPVESNESGSAKKRPGPGQTEHATDVGPLAGQTVDGLDAAQDQAPKTDDQSPQPHPAVAEREARRREQGAAPNPRPVDPEGEQGRGVDRAAGQPADATEGSRNGHDQGEGDQGGLFSERDEHGDSRRDRRDRSADGPSAPREPSQNSHVANMKSSAGVEAEIAAGLAESTDSPPATASSGEPAARPTATNPAAVAAAEASIRGNAAKSPASSPATAADSVKAIDGTTEGRTAAEEGRPINPSGRTEASAGAGKAADGRDGGSEAITRAKLVQRVSRAFQQLGGTGGLVRMRLAPAELGSVRIEMRVQDRRVDARVVAESEAAGQILRDHLPELRHRLESQGMKIERIEIQTEPESLTENGREFARGEHRDGDHNGDPPQHRQRWGRSRTEPLRAATPAAPAATLPPVASPLTAAGVDARW